MLFSRIPRALPRIIPLGELLLDGKFLFGQFAVFALGGFAAAYMAFLLILFQYALDFFIKSFVGFLKLYRNVLMNGAFAYSELLCGRSYRSVVFNNIFSEYYASFLITFAAWFQRLFPPHVIYSK